MPEPSVSPIMPDKTRPILIVGLGLIGGSYARALARRGYTVHAIDTRQEAIDYALREGFIAAGSTITQDIPEGNMCIARSRQVFKPNWERK
mgnify:CR=1 FL=1